ncbi:PilZ domain-containing protein [Caproicibacterium sp. XB1]|uniref:PilZ domain-containing protein n=1 Tax=Caproicibacterium sp. XB1 TaxID=3396405 RepID=UPI0039B6F82F
MEQPEDAYANSPCEVKSEENELLATGILAGRYAQELVIRDPRGALSLEHYNRPVKIYLHSATCGGREYMGKVYISTNAFMRVKDIRLLTERERRGCFRLSISLPAAAYRAAEITRAESANRLRRLSYAERLRVEQQLAGGTLTEAELAARVPEPAPILPRGTQVRLLDLSAGGAQFRGKEAFRAQERLVLHLTLQDKPAELTCLVVRDSAACGDGEAFCTGCRFVEVTSAQNNLICTYLLREQSKQIRKSKRV